MRKLLFFVAMALLLGPLAAYSQDLGYYLPAGVQYDPAIPKPKDIIYHEPGEWHVTHDRLVNYMQALATAAPGRIKLETMGFTYEQRPQVLLIITSPANHQKLETIRQQHVLLTDPARSGSLDIDQLPLVVYIGHSIHGNEPSGANAALLSAYYLAAAQGKGIEELLDSTVILLDPAFNPDGLQRFSTWVNQHKSQQLVTDPFSREFNEVWPGGRFNHYWFDLNRDWLPAVHVESQHRLRWFHAWKPNILTDHHEQGSNATFFFQPGVPSRVNPLTPARNQELTAKLGEFHAAYLDSIGSLYFTKESYDDFYYGKGSTYPDVQGCIGILFEQASSRGHAQQTINGVLRFPFTIRNQFVTTLSTLAGAKALRKELLAWQRDFYKSAVSEASAAPVKGYVYGDAADPAKTALFTEMLRRHQITVHALKENLTAGEYRFEKEKAFLVPAAQPQYRLIRGIFDKTLTYKDSLFYDITAWTMPLAFGLPYAELGAGQYKPGLLGAIIDTVHFPTGTVNGGLSRYAYVFRWDSYYAPRALYELQMAGILTKVATAPFAIRTAAGQQSFDYGSILVPVGLQKGSPEQVYALLQKVASRNALEVLALPTGAASTGVDLGSARMTVLTPPAIALLVGPGVNATDAGEVWHLLDQRFQIPATQLEIGTFNRMDPDRYNTLVMVGGNYNELNKEKLKSWVQGGGTLVLTEEAVTWAAQNGLTELSFRKAKEDTLVKAVYAEREFREGAKRMNGAIFRATIDRSHPLAYGYNYPNIDLFKSTSIFVEKTKNLYAQPFVYGDSPLQSGFITKGNYEVLKQSAAVQVSTLGGGRVISLADNPNFRAYWLGGTKLFLNALFFGRLIDAGSAR
ncbi:MAG: M14 family metallopeptidase [Candidatus Pseudobacter hemicellulosilyticus]|uniref:M14 family metallopeptidase n=1 Tax=Candidatus Pseudobacter hemicellulosilyticus TaxID=3121375 RepID=A0AAJ5WSF5_9BACT|nr:MAG: M14 family metallopeptidase [Pseudobacter sp.]